MVQKKYRVVFAYSLLIIGIVILICWLLFPILFAKEFLPSTKVYDKNGVLLYEVLSPRAVSQYEITYEHVPEVLKNALISSEDRRFLRHGGVDMNAIFSAMWNNTQTNTLRGASTLTNQVVKLRYFQGYPRNILQKMREALLSPLYELVHSKEDILTMYLNRAYFGENNFGIGSAARYYFGKAPERLALHEVALLIGLLPAPERFDPVDHPNEAKERQRIVLQRMKDEQYISQQEMDDALRVPLEYADPSRIIRAPHAVMEALQEEKKKYPELMEGGYVLHLTIDSIWQKEAEELVKKGVEKVKSKQVSNGALVAEDVSTGAIRALVGSIGYFTSEGQVNVAYSKRQPGSSLKPFTYLAYMYFLRQGTGSIFYDIEQAFQTPHGVYRPKNYDLLYHGPVSARKALASSLNIPAVLALDQVGFSQWYELLRKFGMKFDHDPEYYGLGITLGGGEVRLVDLVHGYSLLANGGKTKEQYLVERVEFQGKNVRSHTSPASAWLFPNDDKRWESSVAMLNHMLRDDAARSLSFGPRSLLYINEHVAVKTGTTMDFHDNWVVGYTPQIVVGVWVGNNDNTPMAGVTGVTGAVPIWHNFMRLHEEQTREHAALPSEVKEVEVCALSGKRATLICSDRTKELYFSSDEPNIQDDWQVERDVLVRKNGSEVLWKKGCSGIPLKKRYFTFPLELLSWAAQQGLPLLPIEDCQGSKRNVTLDQWMIQEPVSNEVYTFPSYIPDNELRIPLRINGHGYLPADLMVDGENRGKMGLLPKNDFLFFLPGKHTLRIGEKEVVFYVKKQ